MIRAITGSIDVTRLAIAFSSALLIALWAFPIFWTIIEVAPTIDTEIWFFRPYTNALRDTELGRWYLNSLVTSLGVTAIVIGISACCGYAISQIKFTGRKLIWFVTLGSFLVPVQALIVNHFFLIYKWGLLNTWLGVILPQLIAPIAVIVYKQFFDGLPKNLGEAARLDGAKHWQILWFIFLPMNWGVTLALAIVVFIAAWNTFLWPFLAVTKSEFMNITVGIAQLRSHNINGLTAAIIAGLPVVTIYLLFQRRVTEAITRSVGIQYRL